MSVNQDLARIVDDIVAAEAAEVDRSASFPRKAVDALADAGLLAVTVPAEFGGDGGSLRDAVRVVRTLSGACGSTVSGIRGRPA